MSTTRRDFIRYGALATVFATTAEANPVISIVGAKKNSYTLASPGFQNPYITHGLIAMWDGQWNAGLGVHDNVATVWKDLAGNHDAALTGAYSWEDNAWNVESVSKRGIATWTLDRLLYDQTIEIVVHPTATSGIGRLLAEWNRIASPCIVGQNSVYMYGFNTDGRSPLIDGYDSLALHSHQIVWHYDNATFEYYIDSNMVWQRTSSKSRSEGGICCFANRASDYNRGIDAKYYCVRIYDRALGLDELAHNYMLDKERFGIA